MEQSRVVFAVFVASASVVLAWTYRSIFRKKEAFPQLDPIGDALGRGDALLIVKDGPLVVFSSDKGDGHAYDDALLAELGLDVWRVLRHEARYGPVTDWDDIDSFTML